MIVSADHEKALSYNTEERLFCACTVKAAYCLYACLEIEKQGISLDTPLTYLASHYESGTGDMQYSPVGTVFSLEKTLFKTMSISDNVGYRMLVDFFGREGYNAWIEEMGCDSLKIHPTVWSLSAKAKDLAVVWEKIFEYFQTDTPTARFFKESCTDTDGAYATEALENVSVSHKQGHNSSGKYLAYSDAGILWNGDDPYFYVILTDNPGITAKGKKLMQEVMDPIHHFLFSPS